MTVLTQAFRAQAITCENLGSDFMARLMRLLAQHWPEHTRLAEKFRSYDGDIGPAGHSLPLRIGGGLHALRLQGLAGLEAVYPPNLPDENTFRTAILTALDTHDDWLLDWCDSPPQTNEVRRSAALIPGARLAAERFGLPICLSELGASGGLNLMWDQYAVKGPDWRVGPQNAALTLSPDWSGPAPRAYEPVIADRRGVDLNPLNPSSSDDLLRLLAYLWADQTFRIDMTRAAADAGSAPVDRSDAIDWLEQRLTDAPDGHLHLVQNTVAWQYFPQEAQKRGRALMREAGARSTRTRPLAWLQMETDGDLHGLGGAALTLQIWPSGEVLNLGRADFHGRWVKYSP